MSGATPTVPNRRRVIELKKVLVNSGSGRSVDECGEPGPDPSPALAIVRLWPKRGAQLRDRLVHEAVIELDALDGVALAAL